MEKLRRAKKNKKIAGVCAGIARALEVNPSYIRLIFLVLGLVPPFSTLTIVLIYAGLAIAIPQGDI